MLDKIVTYHLDKTLPSLVASSELGSVQTMLWVRLFLPLRPPREVVVSSPVPMLTK